MEIIWDTFEAWRGQHDFSVEPILNLPNNVEIFCIKTEWEGLPAWFIEGRIAGLPQTTEVLSIIQYEHLGD